MPAIASVLVASATDRAAGVVGLAICTAAKLWGGFVWMGLVAAGAWRLVAISAFATATLFTTSLCVANIETWRHYFENVVPEWLTTTRITVTAYQTVPAFFAHLLRADPQWNPEPLADLPALALALSLIGAGSMLGVTLWAAAVKHLRLPAIAAAAVLAVLYAPLAEQYHYLLIVPSVVVAAERCFLQPGYRTALLTLMPAVALLILPLPYKSSELAEFAGGVFAYPRVVGALMVWTLLVWPLPAAPTTR